MLTPKTLKKLQEEQQKLDEFIVQKNNITDNFKTGKSFIRTKIALLVEIGELANELKTFKHWKKQKEVDWQKAQEELIDCLHFYLSWTNAFQIDFADYNFKKLAPEPDYNELLLAFFSETEAFSINVPWKIHGPKMLAANEKIWEKEISELNPKDKDYQKILANYKKAKEKQQEIIAKMSNNFLEEIEIEKNKTSFYRWLIIFEELAQKLGLKSEKDIIEAYLAKNRINWERQQKNY
ncbi:MAG: dUTP diphosphatase [Mycoplasmataceae bacterium RV_VA103A]|nr:MAG: dUTP diphosphatase [Mycoplasmataceae bacterium RV_VA103A]